MSTSKIRGTCHYCKIVNIIVTRDHWSPRSKNPKGTDHSKNIVWACPWCNNKKRDLDGHEFLAWLQTEKGEHWMLDHYLRLRRDPLILLPPEAVAAIAKATPLTRRQADGSMAS